MSKKIIYSVYFFLCIFLFPSAWADKNGYCGYKCYGSNEVTTIKETFIINRCDAKNNRCRGIEDCKKFPEWKNLMGKSEKGCKDKMKAMTDIGCACGEGIPLPGEQARESHATNKCYQRTGGTCTACERGHSRIWCMNAE